MISKRLLQGMAGEKRYIFLVYIIQIIGLLLNIGMIYVFAHDLVGVLEGEQRIGHLVLVILGIMVARFILTQLQQYFSFKISGNIKNRFREQLFNKVSNLGLGYTNVVSSSEVVQLAVEGIEQLDNYYGRFLPQFFYAVSAPIVLFCFLAPLDIKIATLLLLFVPAIPLAIIGVQALAKKVVGSYWKSYMNLSDRFLDNMQGLNTLKVYQSDELRNQDMNAEAEGFRKATMRVLSMQINNIVVMDIIAYGGAALGTLATIAAYMNGRIDLAAALIFTLLVADYFLPLRQLGSFFHIAMNGIAASDRLFYLLDLPTDENNTNYLEEGPLDIVLEDLSFAYGDGPDVLHHLDMSFKSGEMTAMVGPSGCGKSTIVSLLTGMRKGYKGKMYYQGKLAPVNEDSLMQKMTLVDYNSYLFTGTIRYNLLMANPEAQEAELWNALDKVCLKDFVEQNGGLEMPLLERGQNLSGGQMQRLALARALLKDSEVYIFDEATSSIDAESEKIILDVIHELKQSKTVIFISHRLQSTKMADKIYLLDGGKVADVATFDELLAHDGLFAELYREQYELEHYADAERKQRGDQNENE